ncbi:MAG: hypothetical protein COT81_01870 [Candidatus Buchananbacteria bacterium CG10_big_fil_rev_8_21_14_0_10_42_9]|uniref:2-dehydropantoate 2-reductase n=1 Tax=Candidatus Buchananbacteria bacterium CG10_big_fil_rev_8_21_14_0_10_42_9 TaxID=1974526 RepID=A0A2H0W1W0_9BACT|nr:MAG: hypothetical protein COT81_01870 [Candidatus Buchananbacteria bacterium CG10_big_fil_rev_8_21_14_0_10_42_9]
MVKSFNPQLIAILGPGAIGGLIAAILWKQGVDVIAVGTKRTVDLINKEGLKLDSVKYGRFTAHPKATTQLTQTPDLLFVSTKSTNLKSSLNSLKDKFGLGVALLNGLSHMDILRQTLGPKVIAGSILTESYRQSSNEIVHPSKATVVGLAPNEEVGMSEVKQISTWLNGHGIQTKIYANDKEVLWKKLCRLNALACTTAASGMKLGDLRKNSDWMESLLKCLKEAASVAQAEGVSINIEEEIARVNKIGVNFKSSMLRDIENKKTPELEAIPGAIIDAGSKHGISCPVISDLKNQIKRKVKAYA